jgi:hypothetical protein
MQIRSEELDGLPLPKFNYEAGQKTMPLAA